MEALQQRASSVLELVGAAVDSHKEAAPVFDSLRHEFSTAELLAAVAMALPDAASSASSIVNVLRRKEVAQCPTQLQAVLEKLLNNVKEQDNLVSVFCHLLAPLAAAKFLHRSQRIEVVFGLALRHPAVIEAMAHGLGYDDVSSFVCSCGVELVRAARARDIDSTPVLHWILHRLDGATFSRCFGDVVPQIIRLLNHHQMSSKTLGVNVLRLSLKKVDLPTLRFHSPLIIDILKRDISVREEAQQNLVLPMLLDFLVVVLPRMRPRGKDLTGVVELVMSEVHYLALSGTESSSLVERCELFIDASTRLVALLGPEAATVIRDLLPSLFLFVEHVDTRIVKAALTTLDMLIRACWERMRLHVGKVFESLCRAYAKTCISDRPKPLDRISAVLGTLRSIEPQRVDELICTCQDLPYLRPLFEKAMMTTNNDLFCSTLQWDTKNIYQPAA